MTKPPLKAALRQDLYSSFFLSQGDPDTQSAIYGLAATVYHNEYGESTIKRAAEGLAWQNIGHPRKHRSIKPKDREVTASVEWSTFRNQLLNPPYKDIHGHGFRNGLDKLLANIIIRDRKYVAKGRHTHACDDKYSSLVRELVLHDPSPWLDAPAIACRRIVAMAAPSCLHNRFTIQQLQREWKQRHRANEDIFYSDAARTHVATLHGKDIAQAIGDLLVS